MPDRGLAGEEFAIRVSSVDYLFPPFDARPVAERPLAEEVHDHLLDTWERVRHLGPKALEVYAPEGEHAHTDEPAVRDAIRNDLRASRGPLRSAGPLSRRERLGLLNGLVIFIACIIVSTGLDRLTDDIVLQGVSQGITLLGWVALWRPAGHFVTKHHPAPLQRRALREFAEVRGALPLGLGVSAVGAQWARPVDAFTAVIWPVAPAQLRGRLLVASAPGEPRLIDLARCVSRRPRRGKRSLNRSVRRSAAKRRWALACLRGLRSP